MAPVQSSQANWSQALAGVTLGLKKPNSLEKTLNKHLTVLGLCFGIAGIAPAMAQQAPKASITTEQYVAYCNNKSDIAAQNFCHGFGQGVYETYVVSRHPKNAPHFVCLQPAGASRQQYIDGFVKWTAANARFNQLSAADTILRYLGETYPCKRG
jgi:hypothetical protein